MKNSFQTWLSRSTITVVVFLIGCGSNSTTSTLLPVSDTAAIIATDSVPSPTPSPNATDAYLREINEITTQAAARIPTPFATTECSELGPTQLEMNECAAYQNSDMRDKMNDLVEMVMQNYPGSPEEAKEFLRLQTEWEALADEECSHWWGQTYTNQDTGNIYYLRGTMAPLLVATCLTHKYADRTRELQLFLFYNGR